MGVSPLSGTAVSGGSMHAKLLHGKLRSQGRALLRTDTIQPYRTGHNGLEYRCKYHEAPIVIKAPNGSRHAVSSRCRTAVLKLTRAGPGSCTLIRSGVVRNRGGPGPGGVHQFTILPGPGNPIPPSTTTFHHILLSHPPLPPSNASYPPTRQRTQHTRCSAPAFPCSVGYSPVSICSCTADIPPSSIRGDLVWIIFLFHSSKQD